MAQVTVAIIGLNRISVSLGLALKGYSQKSGAAHQFTIIGTDTSADAVKAARTLKALDQDTRDMGSAVANANIVIVAPPYHQVEESFAAIGEAMPPGAVVLDFSPLRQPSMQWARQYFRKGSDGKAEVYLVGVTPLVAAERLNDFRANVESADAELFKGSSFVLAPAADCPEEAVQLASELAELLEIGVHFADPLEYDSLAAAMETLPLLMHAAFFNAVRKTPGWDDAQRIGNPAFAQATYRLADDAPESVAAALEHNRASTLRALESLRDSLAELTELARTGDPLVVAEAWGDAADQHARWLAARTRNKWLEDGLPNINEAGSFSLLGNLSNLGNLGSLGRLGRKNSAADKKK